MIQWWVHVVGLAWVHLGLVYYVFFSYSNPDAIMMTNLSEVRLEEAEEEEREEEGEEELGVEEEVVEEEDGIETTCLLPLVGSRRY